MNLRDKKVKTEIQNQKENMNVDPDVNVSNSQLTNNRVKHGKTARKSIDKKYKENELENIKKIQEQFLEKIDS